MNSMIVTRDGASFFMNGKSYTIGKDHPNYDNIINAVKNDAWESIPELANIKIAINNAIEKTNIKDLYIKDNKVIYKHITFPDDLCEYVINLVRDFKDLTPIVKFMDKLLANPDHRVFQQLFGFISYGKNPLTPDGNFLAYKKVNADFTSVHDRKFKNNVGTTVSMSRENCNNNPEETCSTGLHFCSKDYLNNYPGDKIVILEISPTDVVSIPVDYNNTKGRACQYKIVGTLTDFEVNKVLNNNDVLKVATVDLKYQASETQETTIVNETKPEEVTEDNIALYNLGYRDGRKKLVMVSDDSFYVQGYKHGRSKKKKIY